MELRSLGSLLYFYNVFRNLWTPASYNLILIR